MPAAAAVASPSSSSSGWARTAARSSRSTARRRWSTRRGERLARFGDRVEYVVADLGQPLPDRRRRSTPSCRPRRSTGCRTTTPCSRNLAAVLRPGGWLVAQCGGVGNIATIQRALATIGDGWLGPVHFETSLATTRRLDAAGFVDIECWLTDEPTRFEPGEPFETYLRTVVLGAHLERLPADEHDAFVHAVRRGRRRADRSTTCGSTSWPDAAACEPALEPAA